MATENPSQANTLALSEPELAKEWHPTLNGELTPMDVSRRNGKKVWWKCHQGHDWEAIVAHRTAGSGCPYCSGRMASPTNNLLAVNPTVAKEWHPTRNDGLRPNEVTPNSGKKVWWICHEGHEWEAAISHRNKGSGCPYCSGHKPSKQHNFATAYPQVAALWHPEKNAGIPSPEELSPRSTQIAWWRCLEGHEWESSIANAAISKKCPVCSNRRIDKSNSLAALNPRIASEWDNEKNLPLTPQSIGIGSGRKVWWRCHKGHEWQSTVVQRTANDTNCPMCKGIVASDEYNFALLYPNESKQWHPTKNGDLKPEDVTPNSGKIVWWLCPKGHETKAAVSSRTKGHGCNKCVRKTSSPEIRIFAELSSIFSDVKLGERLQRVEADVYIPHLQVAFEYDGEYFHRHKIEKDLKKTEKLASVGVKLIRVRCAPLPKLSEEDVLVLDDELTKHDLNMVINSLLSTNHLTDSERSSLEAYISEPSFKNEGLYREYMSYFPDPLPERSLEKVYPHLAAEWDIEMNAPLLPRNFTPYSGFTAAWKCSEGHQWATKINYRVGGTSCPVCREKLRKQGNYTEQEVCAEGHSWKAKYNNGVLQNSCPICSNRKVHSGYNLRTENPDIASEWHPTKNGDLKPEDVTPRSSQSVWWQCKNGHEWKVNISSRTSQNLGCAVCSGRRAASDSNLATEYPELAAQWHPTKNGTLTPELVVSGSAKRVWWQCEKGHEWESAIRKRKKSSGCPFCSGKRADPENNLAAQFPQLMKEWDSAKNSELDPTKLLSGSGKKVWWVCSKGHEWEATIYNRAKVGSGCKQCASDKRSHKK